MSGNNDLLTAGGQCQTSAGQRFKCQDPEHQRFTAAQEARSRTHVWIRDTILRGTDGAPEIYLELEDEDEDGVR